MDKHNFTQNLQEHLKGMNLTELARDLCIPKAVLHDWVRARRLPSLKNIHYVKKLADYLNLTLEELLLDKNPQIKHPILKTIKFEDLGKTYLIEIRKSNE